MGQMLEPIKGLTDCRTAFGFANWGIHPGNPFPCWTKRSIPPNIALRPACQKSTRASFVHTRPLRGKSLLKEMRHRQLRFHNELRFRLGEMDVCLLLHSTITALTPPHAARKTGEGGGRRGDDLNRVRATAYQTQPKPPSTRDKAPEKRHKNVQTGRHTTEFVWSTMTWVALLRA